MSRSSSLGATLVASVLLAGLGFTSAAQADSCPIQFTVYKAGLVIGGQGGTGTLQCPNRTYPISIGGLSYGFMIGASETRFRGTATFSGSPRNVAGVYGAGGVGGAIGRGAQAIVLANQSGAVLALTGYQRGLQINADLSGLAITFR